MALGDLISRPGRAPVTKRDKLIKRLIRLGVTVGIITGILGGIAFGLSVLEDSKREQRDRARNEANNMSSQVAEFQQKLSKAEKSLPIFAQMRQVSGKPEMPLDRLKAREFLDKQSEAYVFTGLRATLAPVRELDNTYKNAVAQGLACDMTLTFEGLSDEHIFALVGDMRKKYMGLIKIMGISATRVAEPDTKTLRNIAQRGKITLVKGDIKLQWLGIKSLKTAPLPATPASPAAQPVPAAPPAQGAAR